MILLRFLFEHPADDLGKYCALAVTDSSGKSLALVGVKHGVILLWFLSKIDGRIPSCALLCI